LAIPVDELGEEGLINVAKTSMSSKLISGENELFSKLCVSAIMHVKTNSNKYPIKNINIVKSHGKSTLDSYFVPGYVTRMS